MTVTDASIWVSRFLPEDAFHAASRDWLMNAASGQSSLIAPASLLPEVAGAIARRTGSTRLGYQAVQQIRQVPNLQLVALDTDLCDFAAEVASTNRLRGADALYVAVAHQLQTALVSWDHEQLERAAGFAQAYRPGGEGAG
jgi:predicted nucleic acid-binding protein